jgi:dephospho-CoA kinase
MLDVVVISGRSCVGKTLGGKFLSMERGFRHVEASEFMRNIWASEGAGWSLDEFAGRLLSRNPSRIPTAILKRFGTGPLVITGLRSPYEVQKLLDLGRSVSALFIRASLATRLERSIGRARDGYQRTVSELCALDRLHDAMGLAELEKLAYVRILRNDGTIENYKRELLATFG